MGEPNKRQRANLLKLARYLEGLPKDYGHFDMLSYADLRGNCDGVEEVDAALRPDEFLRNCGTAACAAGHGPAAGIRLDPKTEIGRDAGVCYDSERGRWVNSTRREPLWSPYVRRAFGVSSGTGLFSFLFGSAWKRADNHHWGAAARIRCYLAEGLPGAAHTWSQPQHDDLASYSKYRKGSRSKVRRAIDAEEAA